MAKPRLRRRTLKGWVRFGFKGVRRRSYKHNRSLHEHEHKVILQDACALGYTAFDAHDLDEKYPGRYNVPTLKVALKRMKAEGLLSQTIPSRTRFRRNRGASYRVKEEIRGLAKTA